jgi:2-hydroxy-6-oxonona-2,4-dienedioate hydrolase
MRRSSTALIIASIFFVVAFLIWWCFEEDLKAAKIRAIHGSVMAQTRCGLIEYQEAGAGIPLLMIHGSGGGHDQGMAFAGALTKQGIRVIAMSRFGYLRTPMPADASPAAQADANVCLLDALGIQKAGVLGASAGGLSAMQTAIRHPDRVSALILVVPLAYKPATVADSAPAQSALAEKVLLQLIGSDFVFWAMLHIAPDQVIKRVLATPPALLATASPAERARVNAILNAILPVSARADGLRNETRIAKNLQPYALDKIRAPSLIISARDDGYGTFASAQYTASQIPDARFIGYEAGGHVLVGHDEEVQAEILKLLVPQTKP